MKAIEGTADMILATFEFDVSIMAHFADNISWSIFDWRKLFGVAALTRLIAGRRHGHRERFMRTLSVIDDAPLIKIELPLSQASTVLITQDFSLEGAMKAFVFTLSLGMMWS